MTNNEHGTWNDEHGSYYHNSMFHVRNSVIVPSGNIVLADGYRLMAKGYQRFKESLFLGRGVGRNGEPAMEGMPVLGRDRRNGPTGQYGQGVRKLRYD